MDTIKNRTIKKEVEEQSAQLENIVDGLVNKYNKDLEDFMEEIRELIKDRDKLTDYELERIALKVPIFMYFSVNGVESLGIQYDVAKAKKQEEFNSQYIKKSGTIKDKEAAAGNDTLSEAVMEMAFSRAYKKLKSKVEACEQLCLSIRKIIGKRTQDLTISKYEGQFNDRDKED